MEPATKKSNVEVLPVGEKSNSNDPVAQELSEILTYDVLRMILACLSYKDLCKAAQVCRSWRDAAHSDSCLRRGPQSLLKRFKIKDRDDSEEMYASELIGEELKIKPVLGLICGKVQEEKEWTLRGCYCQNLPTNCSAVFLGGYDIVLNDTKIDKGFGMAVCSFLPAIPKLTHKIFHIDAHTFAGSSNIDIHAHAEDLVKRLLPTRREKSKCIIMLANIHAFQFSKVILKILKKEYPLGKVSLWGGLCTELKLCEASSSSRTCSQIAQWTAITLSSPSLQSWSMVLSKSCRKEDQIEDKLDKFKQSIQLKKYSLALMFACCERLNKKEMEVAVFKRVFPGMPLIGLHGDGEFGLNTLGKKREDTLSLAYTTIFLVLTYQ